MTELYDAVMARRAMTNPAAVAIYQLQREFGFKKAVWILEFLAKWAIAVRANDWEPIDAEQYAEHWEVSRATGYRDQSIWRDLFPDEPTPNDRVLRGRAEYERLIEQETREPSIGDVAALFCVMPAA